MILAPATAMAQFHDTDARRKKCLGRVSPQTCEELRPWPLLEQFAQSIGIK
jgi:hypothetical protein